MHEHIKYLLYRHNCVVLPGFGGIVLQYSPARIHPAQHIFQPPRKALAFNRSLTTNDGLLVSHLANAEQLHYDEAENRVRRFVEQIEDSIRRKSDFVLNGVGRFHNDVEGNLQFEPEDSENYLLNAYGLDRFVSPAVVRRESFEPNHAATQLPLKKKRRFNWFGLSMVLLFATFIGVEMLSIHNLTSLVTNPLAGFRLFDSAFIDSNANVPSHQTVGNTARGTRDTLVQIIVIKDESNAYADSAANTSVVNATVPTSAAAIATKPLADSGPIVIPVVENTARVSTMLADSASESKTSKVPLRGEYNPAKTGRFVIVFSNSTDSAKATFFQQKLWKDRIGVRVLPYRNRLIVAKQGYMTGSAAAKDLYLYRLLGYDTAYILKMKEE